MKLTHENVNKNFESAQMKKLMHGLVDHESNPKVLANKEMFYQESVRFFWRFWVPLLTLMTVLGAAFSWWFMNNAAMAISIQLAVILSAVAIAYPRR